MSIKEFLWNLISSPDPNYVPEKEENEISPVDNSGDYSHNFYNNSSVDNIVNDMPQNTAPKNRLQEFYEYFKEQNTVQGISHSQKEIKKTPLVVAFMSIVAVIITCVAVDLIKSINLTKENYSLSVVPNIHSQALQYENGEYTTVGIGEVVLPSVVELYNYVDSYSKTEPQGSASGIVLTEDGYILTNEHCVSGADKIIIILNDSEKFEARLVGRDAKTDIAIVKISANNLKPATFADSDKVKLGENCVAVGNPAGFKGSVTNGIISGVNRQISTDTSNIEMECFQTNAEISPGNSGGALCNMYGEVIGITSSKQIGYSYEGLGFAITTNAAKPIIEDIMKNGYVSNRFRLGITGSDTSNPSALELFEEETGYTIPDRIKGVIIFEIDEKARIAESDIEVYDIIISVNDIETPDFDTLQDTLRTFDDSEHLIVQIQRVGKDGFTKMHLNTFLTKDISGDF
ncbi:MAG: S1C family serine protease [Oscillospiraceae bacterium]|jgi:serine protease Do|nr:S1C family serine protease [Oscillospiraceae bacterium]